MAISIGINGLGGLGRTIFRLAYLHKDFNVAAISDPAEPEAICYVLKYDTLFHRFDGELSFKDGCLYVKPKNGTEAKIPFIQKKSPSDIPWKDFGVSLVIDATEQYRTKNAVEGHFTQGAKGVLLTVPPKTQGEFPFFIRGINDQTLNSGVKLFSSGSATAHALLPILKILQTSFGIEKGFMTVARAFTSEQQLLDTPGPDLRLSRAAAQNIIPSHTWSSIAATSIFPELKGKFDAMSMEVPVPDGSLLDIACVLKKQVTQAEVNKAFQQSAQGEFKGLLEYSEEHLVSTDVISNPHSTVFDSLSTSVMGGSLVKIFSWYDNFWAYSNRILELAEKWAEIKA